MKKGTIEKKKKKVARIFKICTWLIAFTMEMFLATGCSSDFGSDNGNINVHVDTNVNVNGENVEGVKEGEMEEADPTEVTDTSSAEKIEIICTSYAAYDWIQNIIAGHSDRFEVRYLLDQGVDLHSYQPGVDDIAAINDCDLLVYVGGESDEWVGEIIGKDGEDASHTFSMMEALGDYVYEEETVEGMEPEAEDADDPQAGGEMSAEEAEGEETEFDEHVWLSVKNAARIVPALETELETLDAQDAADLKKSSDEYVEKLNALDKEYEDACDTAKRKIVLFGDRFPFRYLVEDYGIDYYAAFSGCSAETEASFTTVAFLAAKVNELDIPVVFTIENADTSVAEMIVDNTNKKSAKIITMDSLQSVNKDDIAGGKNYIDTMRSNLEVLKEAMN